MASVCIIMGSKSDEEKVAPCAEILKKLGIGFFMTVSSAHRTPERTETIVREQRPLLETLRDMLLKDKTVDAKTLGALAPGAKPKTKPVE